MTVTEEYQTKRLSGDNQREYDGDFSITHTVQCPAARTIDILVDGTMLPHRALCHSRDVEPLRVMDIQKRDDHERGFVTIMWKCLTCKECFLKALCYTTVVERFPDLLRCYRLSQAQ